MEALFHLVFELIKILFLTSVYSALLLLLFRIVAYYKPQSWFDKTSKKKSVFWLRSGIIIWFSLFIFMFTHWGNHGLGDSARIPLNYGKSVVEINSSIAFVELDDFEQIGISSFMYNEAFLYAKTEELEEKYAVLNLQNDKIVYFESKEAYLFKAEKEHYPHPSEFRDFSEQYKTYWQGWRFLLLP